MEIVSESLDSLGFRMERYHQESYAGEVESPATLPDDTQIYFEQSSISHSCSGAQTILATARSAGIEIPFGRGFGACGTCKVRKTDGEIEMPHNLTQEHPCKVGISLKY